MGNDLSEKIISKKINAQSDVKTPKKRKREKARLKGATGAVQKLCKFY